MYDCLKGQNTIWVTTTTFKTNYTLCELKIWLSISRAIIIIVSLLMRYEVFK